MPNTMREPQVSREVRSLDSIRPTQAKAGLHEHSQSDAVRSFGPELTEVIERTLMLHYGSLKAIAYAFGEKDESGAVLRPMDASQLRREFDTKRLPLARLEGLDAVAKAKVGAAIVMEFGVLTDPKARIRQVMQTIRELQREVEQFVEDVA